MDWMLAHGEDTAQEYRFLVQSALHQYSTLSATYYPDDNISGNTIHTMPMSPIYLRILTYRRDIGAIAVSCRGSLRGVETLADGVRDLHRCHTVSNVRHYRGGRPHVHLIFWFVCMCDVQSPATGCCDLCCSQRRRLCPSSFSAGATSVLAGIRAALGKTWHIVSSTPVTSESYVYRFLADMYLLFSSMPKISAMP